MSTHKIGLHPKRAPSGMRPDGTVQRGEEGPETCRWEFPHAGLSILPTYLYYCGWSFKRRNFKPPQKKNVILCVTIVYAGYGWDRIMIVVSACESVHSNILLVWGWHCFTGIFEGSVNMNDPYPETHIFSALLIGIFWFWLIRGRNF